MRAYEMMIIFHGSLDESTVAGMINKTSDQIDGAGGTIAKVDKLGRQRFAYEINHMTEGFYVVLEIEAEPGALDSVERSLRFADEVVRHKLIRLPDQEAHRRGLLGAAPAEAG